MDEMIGFNTKKGYMWYLELSLSLVPNYSACPFSNLPNWLVGLAYYNNFSCLD